MNHRIPHATYRQLRDTHDARGTAPCVERRRHGSGHRCSTAAVCACACTATSPGVTSTVRRVRRIPGQRRGIHGGVAGARDASSMCGCGRRARDTRFPCFQQAAAPSVLVVVTVVCGFVVCWETLWRCPGASEVLSVKRNAVSAWRNLRYKSNGGLRRWRRAWMSEVPTTDARGTVIT